MEYATNIDWSYLESLERNKDSDTTDIADARAEYLSLEEQINAAYDALAIQRSNLHRAHEAVELAQAAYDDCKRDMTLGGHVVGKNETERGAKLADLLRVQLAQLRDAQRKECDARLNFDIARDKVECQKLPVQVLRGE